MNTLMKEYLLEFMDAQKGKIVNFKNKDVIIESFNLSVEKFDKFYNFILGQDYEGASTHIRPAGNILYNLCEWCYKHYLYKQYVELLKNNAINKSEYKRLKNLLTHKKTNIIYLTQEVKRLAVPALEVADIDLNIISNSAYHVNNGPKHLGNITNPDSYLEVLNIVRKFILTYIDADALLIEVDNYQSNTNKDELLKKFGMNEEQYSYVLITNGGPHGIDNSSSIFNIPWDLVIDFDTTSDNGGLATEYSKKAKVRPLLRDLSRLTIKNISTVCNVPYWIMGSGFSDRPETIVSKDQWIGRYGRYLTDFFEKFYSLYTRPVKVVILFEDKRIVSRIVEDIDAVYSDGGKCEFIVFNDYENKLEDYYNVTYMQSSVKDFVEFLEKRDVSKDIIPKGSIVVPADTENKVTVLDPEIYATLSNFGQLVYFDIDLEEKDIVLEDDKEEFLKGLKPISWYGLRRNFDIKRDEYLNILTSIIDDLKNRGRLLRTIEYDPGVGGTTLLRRVAWDVHREYPTYILSKYIDGQTDEQIFQLYKTVRLPILVLIDSNEVNLEDSKRLSLTLRKNLRTFPFTIIYMNRIAGLRERGTNVTKRLGSLNIPESLTMKEILVPFINENVQDRKQTLEQICSDPYSSGENTPFIMSMYAFQEEFKGVRPFINRFLEPLNKEQKKILVYLALVDFSINKSIDSQFFFNSVKEEEMNALLGYRGAFDNLVKVEHGNKRKSFKIRYPLFSKEILIQISNHNKKDNESEKKIIFSNLLNYIINFIEDSRYNSIGYSREMIEILRTLFITRAEEDMIKSTFAPLIETLRKEATENQRELNPIIGRIFQKLAETYPDESHFIAHLARYYFYIDKNYEAGINCIDEAISVADGEDSLLYHMKGMGYVARITQYYIPNIKKHNRNNRLGDVEELLNELINDAEIAFSIFNKVRDIKSNGNEANLAGFISEIMLCVHIVDMGKSISNSRSTEEFINQNLNHWYNRLMDKACSLFEDCKKFADESDESLIEETEGYIKSMLGDLEKTILTWEKYLKSSDSSKPQIRRLLARAYESKIEKTNVRNINQDDIHRIINLMEENILEEPNKATNIRIWFNAIRLVKTNDPDKLLEDAIILLNDWIRETETAEAYYYHFILTFIKAVNGSTLAESNLPYLLTRLKNSTSGMINRTNTYEWLGIGDGIDSLIKDKEFFQKGVEHINSDRLLKLTGRINENFVRQNHAYISLYGIDVFFNPSSTVGIDKTKINRKVSFGLGFSFDGPRAFHNSVKLLDINEEEIKEAEQPNKKEYQSGDLVKCEIVRVLEYYVICSIVDSKKEASIHISEFNDRKTVPNKGSIIDAVVTRKKFLPNRNKSIIELSIEKDRLEAAQPYNPFKEKLKNIKILN